MVSKDNLDTLSGRMDTAERNITELTRAVGKIEGSLPKFAGPTACWSAASLYW